MENRILARLDGRADPEWLLTLLSVRDRRAGG